MTRNMKFVRLFATTLALVTFLFAGSVTVTTQIAVAQEDVAQPVVDDDKEPPEEQADSNAGLEALNQAIEIKMSAETMRDLNSVIRLCEKAKEDGLSADHLEFCNQLLAATLIQRGVMIADLILENRPLPPGWKEYRNLAVADFEKAFKYIPEEPMNYLYIARLNLLPDGDRELSAKYAEKAIEYCSGNDEIHAQALIVKADLADDSKEQIELLREANRVLPDSLPIMILLGGVLAADNQLDESIEMLQKVLDLDPENVAALEFAAAIRVEQKKYDEAIKIFERLEEILPNSFVPQIQKAEVLQEQKKYDEAMAILNAIRNREPGNPLILLQRGVLFAQMKDYESAMRDIDSTLRLAGDLPDLEMRANSAKITVLCEQEKFVEALTYLTNLPEAKQNLFGYKLMKVQVYAVAKSNALALEVLDDMLIDQPDNAILKRFRGDMLLGLGRHKEAIAVYEELLAEDDADDGVYNNLSWVLATSPDDSLRDGKRALEYALKSCELTHYQKPHILSTLASAYAETGNFDHAIEWIEKGLELADQTEYDQRDHLADELKSYQEKKPWRERLEENNPDPLKPADDDAADDATESTPESTSPDADTDAVDEDIFEAVDE